jgi:quercetin dioxygenase-like cupin family protein
MSKSITIRKPVEGRWIAQSGDINRFLAVSEDTGGAYSQWEAIVPPGGGPLLHVHSREDESFYVLEGELVFQLGDIEETAAAGTFVSLPVGIPHCFRNKTQSMARLLITVVPGGLEGLFFESGTEVESGTTIGQEPPPDEKERIRAAAPRYGIRLLQTQ